MRPLYVFIAIVVTATLFAQPKTFTLQGENDSWFGDSDDGYTNGTRLLWSWEPKEASPLGKLAAIVCRHELTDTCRRTVTAGLGQTMYTPRNLGTPLRTVGDRPYGGWLFGTLMFDATRATTNDHVELYAGVIGPHSYAAEAQTFIHQEVTPAATDPEGWDHQIGEFAGVLATYERRQQLLSRRSGDVEWFDLSSALGGAAGNVFVNGNATATARLGYNLPERFISPIQEAAPLALDGSAPQPKPKPNKNWDAYVYAAANAAYVARNIFLDAEDEAYRIEREPNVREHRMGVSVRIRKVRLAYQHTWRSSEFSTFIGGRTRAARDSSYDMVLLSFGPEP
ncbi:MAG: lipid A deacylase LpxR family protein [Thermoanaerobaculia bacterium]